MGSETHNYIEYLNYHLILINDLLEDIDLKSGIQILESLNNICKDINILTDRMIEIGINLQKIEKPLQKPYLNSFIRDFKLKMVLQEEKKENDENI